MNHQLPALPYAYEALEPVINAEIMQLHHQKHHQAYVNNLNVALQQYEQAQKEANIQRMIALQPLITFNGGGHLNHMLFWNNLAPVSQGGGQAPEGSLMQALEKKYHSFQQFIDLFNQKAVAIQGSGWCWLGMSQFKTLCIMTTANQDPLSHEFVPLLGIDVWEHAYYLQYKNARAEYLKNIWKVVSWKEVARRYNEIK